MTLSIIMASRVFVNSEAFSSPCGPTTQGPVVETEAEEDCNDNLEEDNTGYNEDSEEDEVQRAPSSSTSTFRVHSSQQGEVLHLSLHPAPPLIHILILELRERRLNIYLITTNLSVSKWDMVSIS